MNNQQPNALRLADECDDGMVDFAEAAAELRRLYAENATQQAVMQQALEAMVRGTPAEYDDAITALREQLKDRQ